MRTGVLVGSLLMVAASGARADDSSWASRDYDFGRSQLDDFTSRFERDLVNPTNKVLRTKRATTKVPARNTTVVSAPTTPVAPAEMARAAPPARRAEAEAYFAELLRLFHQVEAAFGLAPYDVATAVAGFLAASYGALHGAPIPDAHFKALVTQLRTALASQPQWAKLAAGDKQAMYEQLAIMGMHFTATQLALAKHDDAALSERLRVEGKRSLETFLKTDAAQVRISANGLELGQHD